MKKALFALFLTALPTAPLAAQVSADFTPRLGAYVPLKDLIVGTDPATGLPARARAETKFTIGGRLGLWLTPSLGLEGVVDYNKGGVVTYLGGLPVTPTAGSHFFGGTGRARNFSTTPAARLSKSRVLFAAALKPMCQCDVTR